VLDGAHLGVHRTIIHRLTVLGLTPH
jgi:hypothetical protein